jgi:NAD(P)-dependent dehydrogenase (short-subunit alcohol dehydrogenase family)
MELAGAVVLVTGASRGIGRATAELLAARGAQVVAVARNGPAVAAVAAATGGLAVPADLRRADAADTVVGRAVERYGRLDAVVANAGIGYAGPVAGMTAERVAALVDVNLRAPLLLARAATAAFTAQAGTQAGTVAGGSAGAGRPGALVFVTSIAGAVGVPGESVYSATKAGVESFAALLREEVRDQGITVSTVVPGVVDTGFFTERGVPYDRRFPRPLPAERIARAVVRSLERGTPRRVVPRWLAVPAWLSAAVPRPYRALARRLS